METFTLEEVIGAWLIECGLGPEVLLLCATNITKKTCILMAAEPDKPEICTGYFTYGPDGKDQPSLMFRQKVFNPSVHYTDLDPFIRPAYRAALSGRGVEAWATWNEQGESFERHLTSARATNKPGTVYNKLMDGPFGTGGKKLSFPEPLVRGQTLEEKEGLKTEEAIFRFSDAKNDRASSGDHYRTE